MAGVVIAVVGALALSWLALAAYVWVARPDRASLREALRLLPDVIRMVRRLAADRSIARGPRIRLWLLMAYLAMPIDLVPDVVPVIGHADDVVIAVAVLRSVVRAAGPDAIRRAWPGSPDGLRALWRLARLPGEA